MSLEKLIERATERLTKAEAPTEEKTVGAEDTLALAALEEFEKADSSPAERLEALKALLTRLK